MCVTCGQVKVEDAGFDWKILGPDVQEEEYVAHTCDQDAYAYRYVQLPALKLAPIKSNFVPNQSTSYKYKDTY